jgi:hemerythrin-like domain-containing protein
MPIQIGQRESDFTNPLGLLSDCHRRIERFLSVLSKVARERRGGPLSPDESAAVERALRYFREAAPKHTHDEEDSLFPRIRDSREAVVMMDELEADHTTADSAHREVDSLGRRWVKDGSLPEDSAARLIEVLDQLQGLYARHIGIEDRELFPLAARLLDREKLTAIGNEMASRRSPK